MSRWHATIHYRMTAGIIDVEHDVEEIEDLQPIVEAGPHWDTIEKIVIVRGAAAIAGLTVEKAMQL